MGSYFIPARPCSGLPPAAYGNSGRSTPRQVAALCMSDKGALIKHGFLACALQLKEKEGRSPAKNLPSLR